MGVINLRSITNGDGKKSIKKDQGFRYFLLISPFLVLVFLFAYFPLHGWIYSFYDFRPALGLSGSNFVGFQWFEFLFGSQAMRNELRRVMTNTFVMSFLNLGTSLLPLFMAMFLNEMRSKRFKKSVQILTTLPNFISWILVYSMAFMLFSTSGMVNTLLQNIGVTDSAIRFLDTTSRVVWFQMLGWGIWKGLGWGTIIYLAAIAGIDQELYEAAKVDGANRFQLMRHITFPGLLPTYLVLLLLGTANLLNNGLEQYFVFQNAFNRNHIEVLDLYIYNVGIAAGSTSLGTAISMMKSVISIILLFCVNFISKKIRGESII